MKYETTEHKSIPEALHLIASWIEKGLTIEWRSLAWPPEICWSLSEQSGFYPGTHIYRAKPRKPRTGCMALNSGFLGDIFDGVELTPEVRSVLEREGLL